MAVKKALAKPLTPVVKRYTIETVSKFSTKFNRNLPQLLSLFPNYGAGFKIFMKHNKDEYFILDRAIIKSNKHAKLYGIPYSNGIMNKKIEKLKFILKKGIWNFEPSFTVTTTDNGIDYNIGKYEELIKQKKMMLEQRGIQLGLPNPLKLKKEEIKKAKEAASSKPKKKF